MEKTCFALHVTFFFFNVSYVSCCNQSQSLFKIILFASLQHSALLFFAEENALKICLG